MKIVLLNGNSDRKKKAVDLAAADAEAVLKEQGHQVESILLREKDIKECIGCFGCWVKTPGLCIHKDDMKQILKKLIESEIQLMVSDVRFGMLSPTLLSAINRFLPMGCAYMRLDENKKSAHYPRYNLNWKKGLLIEDFHGRDEQRLKDISYCLNKNNKNKEKNYIGTFIIGKNDKELIDALNNN
ncbi:MAG: flavodoxin family protein [bacterium]|nr:flavodoxin family protein [bacterium]